MFKKIKIIFFSLVFFIGSVSLFQSLLADNYCQPQWRCMDVTINNRSADHMWRLVTIDKMNNVRLEDDLQPVARLEPQSSDTVHISPNDEDECYWYDNKCDITKDDGKNPKLTITYELYMKGSNGEEYRTDRFVTLYIEEDYETWDSYNSGCYYYNHNPGFTTRPTAQVWVGADEFATVGYSREGECNNDGNPDRKQLRNFDLY